MRQPGSALSLRRAEPLETVWVVVPEAAVEAYEAALSATCETSAFFIADEPAGTWRVEGVREASADASPLLSALAVASALSGVSARLERAPVPSDDWLRRSYEGFPEQHVGRRFLVRGTHAEHGAALGRIAVVLDAGLAFGSGEHGSTRGCLRALEAVAARRPRHVLDLGTGSGILAIAAAKLLRRPVLATDIEPWSVRTARDNARLNGVAGLVQVQLADGWRSPVLRRAAPYDLVFANILARPLTRMAARLAGSLAPGGAAILSGLLKGQARQVLTAHRRHGLALRAAYDEGAWRTLVLRRKG